MPESRLFAEQVVGPGAWDLMPPDRRAAMTANARTFADEVRDPAGWAVDLEALAALGCRVLLTYGDQSPPFFAAVISRLTAAVERAEGRTLTGAGHVPHVTHPAEWVAVVKEFAGRAASA